jgi:KaiC/GvpD/RAD55 family RecA-like ATPase
MQKSKTKRMPTGISSLDPILDGGIPPGSVVLLLGDLGAGSYEFVYSSLVNILNLIKGGAAQGSIVPSEIRYITFTRVKEDVKNEIVRSFQMDNLDQLVEILQFDDLSELYFDSSIVPNEWYSRTDVFTRLQKRSGQDSTLVELSNVINSAKQDSLIILDSITDISSMSTTPAAWQNLTGVLRGLQRISKQRMVTSYLLLNRGILESSKEQELADIADALLLFKWEESSGARRQRVMYFEKFRGVMPYLEERDLVKFAVRISATSGFEVSNIRMVI